MNYWLLKTEPEVYSIDDLERNRQTSWDGVRNFQARNFLRDRVKKGDQVFFYHSNADPSGIAGIAEIIREGYPEPSAANAKSKYYDPKHTKEKPVWFAVDLAFVKKFKVIFALDQIRQIKGLEKMPLLKHGQRLSVQPVSSQEWARITQVVDS